MKYSIIASTYHNNTYINCNKGTVYADTKPEDKTIHVTWDNLIEIYIKTNLLASFNIQSCKKGKRVSFFPYWMPIIRMGDYADVKEWKTKDLNVTIYIKYVEIRD